MGIGILKIDIELATPLNSAAQQAELQKLGMARGSQGGKKDNESLLANARTMLVLLRYRHFGLG